MLVSEYVTMGENKQLNININFLRSEMGNGNI